MNKICIIGGNFATGNMGVGALTMGAITCLNHAYPQADIFIMDYSVNPDRYLCRVNKQTLMVPLVNIRFSKNLFLSNNIAFLILLAFLSKIPFINRFSKAAVIRNPVLRELMKTDLVASLAGGDSFSDIYGFGRFLYVTLPQILALLIGRKLVLMPQTLGPFNGPVTRAIAKQVMSRARLVFSRDEAGITETKRLFKNKLHLPELRFCYDVAFVLAPEVPDHGDVSFMQRNSNTGRKIIGLNVSGLLLMGGYSKKNMFALKSDYHNLVSGIIDSIMLDDSAVVALIPHVFGPSAESDSSACARVFTEAIDRYPDRLFCVSGSYNQNQIKYIIGLCDFFIGSRMHANIAALSQGIPAISIAYSDKFIGVMKTLGMESLCMDPRAQEISVILTGILRALDRNSEIRAVLQAKTPMIQKSILEQFTENNFT